MGNVKKAKYFYDQGLKFLRCAERCLGDVNEDGSIQILGGKHILLSSPAMVNSAFSCECFLKAILIYEEVEYGRSHGLEDLYNLLPHPEYKEWLKVGNNFEVELKKHSQDFVKWRYYMEQPGEYSMSPMFTFIMMNNLKTLVKNIIDTADKERGV